MGDIKSIIQKEKDGLHIHEFAFINADQVIFLDEVRTFCENNACGMYGKTWACPPAVGSMKDCIKKCGQFENAFVFTTFYKLDDAYDIDEWHKTRKMHEAVTENVVRVFRSKFPNILALSAEGCSICKTCTYPEKPCRFPELMFPSIEGFGILVNELSKTAGIIYYNGPDTITYFSMIFF